MWLNASLNAFFILLSGLLGGGSVIAIARIGDGSSDASRERYLGIGSAFGGGVFLGAGYCHLLDDAVKQLASIEYPLALLCSALGLLCTFLIELAGDCLIASRGSSDHQCRRRRESRSNSPTVSTAGLQPGSQSQLEEPFVVSRALPAWYASPTCDS